MNEWTIILPRAYPILLLTIILPSAYPTPLLTIILPYCLFLSGPTANRTLALLITIILPYCFIFSCSAAYSYVLSCPTAYYYPALQMLSVRPFCLLF